MTTVVPEAVHPAARRPSTGERIAAVIALVALAGTIALAVVGLTSHWTSVAIATIALAVIVVAGWYAVSRRGTRRVIATVVVCAGVVVLVAAILLADLDLVRVGIT